jgi:hypothetical protein
MIRSSPLPRRGFRNLVLSPGKSHYRTFDVLELHFSGNGVNQDFSSLRSCATEGCPLTGQPGLPEVAMYPNRVEVLMAAFPSASTNA